jgi:hypothetical protein
MGIFADPGPSEWIPVVERLPEEGVSVVVYRPNAAGLVMARRGDWWELRLEGMAFAFEVTDTSHWMPLPPPPVEDEKEAPR